MPNYSCCLGCTDQLTLVQSQHQYDEFWEEAEAFVETISGAASNRRGSCLYAAQPVSVEDFVRKVKERMEEKLKNGSGSTHSRGRGGGRGRSTARSSSSSSSSAPRESCIVPFADPTRRQLINIKSNQVTFHRRQRSSHQSPRPSGWHSNSCRVIPRHQPRHGLPGS